MTRPTPAPISPQDALAALDQAFAYYQPEPLLVARTSGGDAEKETHFEYYRAA